MIYSLVGSNIHAVRLRVQELFKQSDAQNIIRLDSELVEFDEIIQSLGGQSLFGDDGFVVIKNLSKNSQTKDKIEEIIKAAEQSICLLIEGDLDKRTKYYKTLKKQTKFEDFTDLNPAQAAEFVKTYSSNNDRTIASTDAMYLVSRVGIDQARLANELDKLFLYSKKTTKEEIDELTEPTLQDSVFNLTDAISAKNTKKALEIYSSLRQQQVHPMEIMGTLSWHLHTVTQIFFNRNQGSPQQIAKLVGLHPFVVEKNLRSVKALTTTRLKEIINQAVEADQTLKTKSLNPDDVVETLLIKLCS